MEPHAHAHGRPSTVRATLDAVLDSGPFGFIMVLATVYSLFGEDVRLSATGPGDDAVFLIVTALVLALFLTEMAMRAVARDDYLLPMQTAQPAASSFEEDPLLTPASNNEVSAGGVTSLWSFRWLGAAGHSSGAAGGSRSPWMDGQGRRSCKHFMRHALIATASGLSWSFSLLPRAVSSLLSLGSFQFWLDALAIASMAVDCVVIAQDLRPYGEVAVTGISHDSANRAAFISLARAGRASRAGARAGLALRLFRILRKMRTVDVSGSSTVARHGQRGKGQEDGASRQGSASSAGSDPPSSKTSLGRSSSSSSSKASRHGLGGDGGHPDDHHHHHEYDHAFGDNSDGKDKASNKSKRWNPCDVLLGPARAFQARYDAARASILAETRVGARLTEVMTQRVVLGVLLLVVAVPLLSYVPVDKSKLFSLDLTHAFALLAVVDNATYGPGLAQAAQVLQSKTAATTVLWKPAALSLNGSTLADLLPYGPPYDWASVGSPLPTARVTAMTQLACTSYLWLNTSSGAYVLPPLLQLMDEPLCVDPDAAPPTAPPFTLPAGASTPLLVPIPFTTTLYFDITGSVRNDSNNYALLTLVILTTIVFGSALFTLATNRLVLQPLEKMVLVVKRLSANPLASPAELLAGTGNTGKAAVPALFDARSLELHGLTQHEGMQKPLSARQMTLASGGTEATETRLLLRALMNMGPLLRLGFGTAGAGTITRSLNPAGEIVPTQQGRMVHALYVHVRLKHIRQLVDQALGTDRAKPAEVGGAAGSGAAAGAAGNAAGSGAADSSEGSTPGGPVHSPSLSRLVGVDSEAESSVQGTGAGAAAVHRSSTDPLLSPTPQLGLGEEDDAAALKTTAEEAVLLTNAVMVVVHAVAAAHGARIASADADGALLQWVLPAPDPDAAQLPDGRTPWTSVADTAVLALYRLALELARLSADIIGVPLPLDQPQEEEELGQRSGWEMVEEEDEEDDVLVVSMRSPTAGAAGGGGGGAGVSSSTSPSVREGPATHPSQPRSGAASSPSSPSKPRVAAVGVSFRLPGREREAALPPPAAAIATSGLPPVPSALHFNLRTPKLFGGKSGAAAGVPTLSSTLSGLGLTPGALTTGRQSTDRASSVGSPALEDPQPDHLLSLPTRLRLQRIMRAAWQEDRQAQGLPAIPLSSFVPDASMLVVSALHAGWGVEGLIGSDRKLGAGIVGPHAGLPALLTTWMAGGERALQLGAGILVTAPGPASTARAPGTSLTTDSSASLDVPGGQGAGGWSGAEPVAAGCAAGAGGHMSTLSSSSANTADACINLLQEVLGLPPLLPQPVVAPGIGNASHPTSPTTTLLLTHPVLSLLSPVIRDKVRPVDVVQLRSAVSVSGDGLPIGFEPWAVPQLSLDPNSGGGEADMYGGGGGYTPSPFHDPDARTWDTDEETAGRILGCPPAWADQYRMLTSAGRCRDSWRGALGLFAPALQPALLSAVSRAGAGQLGMSAGALAAGAGVGAGGVSAPSAATSIISSSSGAGGTVVSTLDLPGQPAAGAAAVDGSAPFALPPAPRLAYLVESQSEDMPRLPDSCLGWPTLGQAQEAKVAVRDLPSSSAQQRSVYGSLGISRHGSAASDITAAGAGDLPLAARDWAMWDASVAFKAVISGPPSVLAWSATGVSSVLRELVRLATAGSVHPHGPACMSQAIRLLLGPYVAASHDGYDQAEDEAQAQVAMQAVKQHWPAALPLVRECLSSPGGSGRVSPAEGRSAFSRLVPDEEAAGVLLAIAWRVHGLVEAGRMLGRLHKRATTAQEAGEGEEGEDGQGGATFSPAPAHTPLIPGITMQVGRASGSILSAPLLPYRLAYHGHPDGLTQKQALLDTAFVQLPAFGVLPGEEGQKQAPAGAREGGAAPAALAGLPPRSSPPALPRVSGVRSHGTPATGSRVTGTSQEDSRGLSEREGEDEEGRGRQGSSVDGSPRASPAGSDDGHT